MEVDETGFPLTSIREIKILQSLKHENIITLREVVVGYKQTKQVFFFFLAPFIALSNFLVFDYCDTDLANLLDYFLDTKRASLSLPEIKAIILQIIRAVEHLHTHSIIHR